VSDLITQAKTIAFIETRFQAVNLLEFLESQTIAYNQVWLVTTSRPGRRHSFEDILKDYAWAGVTVIQESKTPEAVDSKSGDESQRGRKRRGFIYECYAMLRFILQQTAERKTINRHLPLNKLNPDRVICGNIAKPVQQHMAGHFPEAELVLIDDGTLAIHTARERNQGIRASTRWSSSIVRFLYSRLAVNKVLNPRPVCYFSLFDLEHGNEDELIKNKLTALSRRVRASDYSLLSGQGVIIGQPIIENGTIDEERFIEALRSGMQACPLVERWLYIRHPRESGGIVDKIKNELQVEMAAFEYSIEEELFAYLQGIPACFLGFCSTSFFTFPMLVGDQARFVAINPFNPGNVSRRFYRLLDIYDELKKRGHCEVLEIS
jgi:hypothetical protein